MPLAGRAVLLLAGLAARGTCLKLGSNGHEHGHGTAGMVGSLNKLNTNKKDHDNSDARSSMLVVLNGYPGGHDVLLEQGKRVLSQRGGLMLTSHVDAELPLTEKGDQIQVHGITPSEFCSVPAVGHHKHNCNRADADNKFLGSAFLANHTQHGFRWLLLGDDDTTFFLEQIEHALEEYNPRDPHYFGMLMGRRGANETRPAGYEKALSNCPRLGPKDNSTLRFWSVNLTADITDVLQDCDVKPFRDDSWFSWAKGGNGIVLSAGILDRISASDWQQCVDRIVTFGGDVRIALCLALLGFRVERLEEGATGRLSGHKLDIGVPSKSDKKSKIKAAKGGKEERERGDMVQHLKNDKLFSLATVHSKPAKSVSEDCKSWKGEGLSCEIEYPEHDLVRQWIPSDATVMEFGARFGTTSCELAKQLNNSGNLVVVEPDINVWGFLEKNLKAHHCNARVLRGAISSTDLHVAGKLNVKHGYANRPVDKGGKLVPGYRFHEVQEALGSKVDTLLIDCEGCAQFMMDQLSDPIKSGQIKLIIIEGDMPLGAKDCHHNCMDYNKFFDFLKENGFEMVDKFNDCDRTRTGAKKGQWCGTWIDHFAWRLKGEGSGGDKKLPVALHSKKSDVSLKDDSEESTASGEEPQADDEAPVDDPAEAEEAKPAKAKGKKAANLKADKTERKVHVAKVNATVEGRSGRAAIKALKHDKLFFEAVRHEGHAKSVSEGCSSWKGEGISCEIEYPEHDLVRKWIPRDSVVMEFGARFGTTSCEIAKQQKNTGNLVVVEPDLNVWKDLESNLEKHKCNAHVLRGGVSATDIHVQTKPNLKRGYSSRPVEHGGSVVPGFTFDAVQAALGKVVDTLLIDCEGCAQDMMDEISGPIKNGQIKLIIIEGDMPVGAKDCKHHCMDYQKFFEFLEINGFEEVDKFNDCDRKRTGAKADQWCGKWIDHFAFRLKKDHVRDSSKAVKLLKQDLHIGHMHASNAAKSVSESCKSWKGDGLDCQIEYPEHALVKKWLSPKATVMEFGARFGTTSCEIAKRQRNSGNLIVVEPDLKVWKDLEGNLAHHKCNARVLKGAISNTDLHVSEKPSGKMGYSNRPIEGGGKVVPGFRFEEVQRALKMQVDTLLIDCEGCAQDMMDQLGPPIRRGQIKLIIIEGDMPKGAKDCKHHCMDYDKFFRFLHQNGFEKVDEFNDCDRERTGASEEQWCGKWINHYAFRLK